MSRSRFPSFPTIHGTFPKAGAKRGNMNGDALFLLNSAYPVPSLESKGALTFRDQHLVLCGTILNRRPAPPNKGR